MIYLFQKVLSTILCPSITNVRLEKRCVIATIYSEILFINLI